MDFMKKNKKGVLLIVGGILAIVGSYIGLNEDAQKQIVNVISLLL